MSAFAKSNERTILWRGKVPVSLYLASAYWEWRDTISIRKICRNIFLVPACWMRYIEPVTHFDGLSLKFHFIVKIHKKSHRTNNRKRACRRTILSIPYQRNHSVIGLQKLGCSLEWANLILVRKSNIILSHKYVLSVRMEKQRKKKKHIINLKKENTRTEKTVYLTSITSLGQKNILNIITIVKTNKNMEYLRTKKKRKRERDKRKERNGMYPSVCLNGKYTGSKLI